MKIFSRKRVKYFLAFLIISMVFYFMLRQLYYGWHDYLSTILNLSTKCAGPSIQKKGGLGDVEVLSLAPMFLFLMGETISPTMNGQLIRNIIKK